MPRKPKTTTIDLGFLRGEGQRTDMSGMFAQSIASESDMQQAALVPVDSLHDNPYQPRMDSPAEGILELASVIKSQGFQGVLIARPHPKEEGAYQLTAGHRRREAARRAGLRALPVVVRELTDEEMVTLAITENIQREDLSPLEEGKIYLLMSEEMGFTHEQIAKEVGKKRGYVENRIRVARAPRDVQALVQAKPDSIRAVANLIKVKNEGDRADVIEHLLAGTLTVEDLPGYIESKAAINQAEKVLDEARAIFNKHGGAIPGEAGDAGAAGRGSEKPEPPLADVKHTPRSAARIGTAKLAAVARYLTTYKEQAQSRTGISQHEKASLAKIKSLVDDLYLDYVEGSEATINEKVS